MSTSTPAAALVPRNPDFEATVRESFSRQTFMTSLGATLSSVVPGEIHVDLPYNPQFCQQNGFMHGGALTSVADSANGYAAFTLADPGTDVLAVEFKISLLAPAVGPRFRACGRVLRPGRTLTFCQADVFALHASGPVLVATMLSTIIIRPIPRPTAQAA